MRCKNCGMELIDNSSYYFCRGCESSFSKTEFVASNFGKSDFIISGGILKSYVGNGKEVRIPEGVAVIGRAVFKDNVMIEKVVFPSTITRIEDEAFKGCINLKELCNFSNVAYLGNEAFSYSGLNRVEIGSRVAFIGKLCFSRMPNLTDVCYMPEKNLKLNHTFAYCNRLTEVEMDWKYFFPSFRSSLEVRNNPNNQRPTYTDAFIGTPYIMLVKSQVYLMLEEMVCPDCGGKIKKTWFHIKCSTCNIDYTN